eukprot:TRINITY_DN15359_c0_g1_i1.p1 TRINITY_DN15359_c0_g1~~TRINITY_DN15359_c0_g1_i1.p1  ORF type:complete len:1732 (+),score=384.14 TRINITY_DN15359_c0_g1_i1:60-5255(+)
MADPEPPPPVIPEVPDDRRPADDGIRGRKNKDIQQVGLSVYVRKKIRQDDKEGKPRTKTYWILEGKTFEDKEFVWEERRAREGHIQYRLLATGKSSTTLPDAGATPSAVAGGVPSQLGPASPRRVKVDPRSGWTTEKKALVQAAVRKRLTKPLRDKTITTEGQKILVKNVTDKYMNENDPFSDDTLPAPVEKHLQDAAKTALDTWLAERNEASDRLNSVIDFADLNFIDGQALEEEVVLPEKPLRDPKAPLSPLLPHATYLRDPYYYMRIDFPNPQRSELEEDLELRLFNSSSMGEIKILGAVNGWAFSPTSSESANQKTILAVVRDWVGAHCLVYIKPPDAKQHYKDQYFISACYPLNDHVEVGKLLGKQANSDALRSIFVIDDERHALGFASAEDHRYMEHTLKLAMCNSFNQGSDNKHIVHARAHNVEFAYSAAEVADDTVLMKFHKLMADENLTTTISEPADLADSVADVTTLVDTDIGGQDTSSNYDGLVNDIRQYMLGTTNRDIILKNWCATIQKNLAATARDPSPATVLRQCRIVEEAIRYAAPTNDPLQYETVLATLTKLLSIIDRSGGISPEEGLSRSHPRTLIPLWKITCEHTADFISRESLPDLPYPKCFDPAPKSEAAAIQEKNQQERKQAYMKDQLASGAYLMALVYCDDELLCDSHLNPPTESITDVLTDVQVAKLGRDSSDFRWLLEQGCDPNWGEQITDFATIYDNAGTNRFRAQVLEAVTRMKIQLGRPDIGIIFDNVIYQEAIPCLFIVTVLRLQRRGDIPLHESTHAGWGWRPLIDVEFTTYLKASQIRAATRVAFLPSSYNNCRRWMYAALRYRESMDDRLHPGVYLAYFGVCPSSTGYKMMVSDEYRYLIPMAKIQNAHPTLEEWRWVQCLNEKKSRVNSFEWHTISDTVTASSSGADLPSFRHRFLRAVYELQQTVGQEVRYIYDMEIIPFDQEGTIKVIAVGERFFEEPPPHTPPPGTTQICWKNSDMVECCYLHQYWPASQNLFQHARRVAMAAQLRTCQPFAADEALRLQYEGALTHLLEIDSMHLPLKWFWSLWMWTCSGYSTLVQQHGGEIDKSIVQGIEESVETAASNFATSQDINHLTMRSLVMDVNESTEWDRLYSKLREISRTMRNGYGERIQQVPTTLYKGEQRPRERTFDELYSDEGSDDNEDRPPHIYEVDCTLEELIERDAADQRGEPNNYFAMQSIVNDMVDLSLNISVDVNATAASRLALSDMITILEWTDELVNDAVVLCLKQQAEEEAFQQNLQFKKVWFDIFNDSDDERNDNLFDSDDEADDIDAVMYHQGTHNIVQSPEEGVRFCLSRSMNSVHQCEELLKVITSAQEVAELTDAISDYDTAVSRQVNIIRQAIGTPAPSSVRRGSKPQPSYIHSPQLSYGGHDPSTIAESPIATVNDVSHLGPSTGLDTFTIVSSDYKEFIIQKDKALRCVDLQTARDKIRFPTVSSSILKVLAYFLSVEDDQLAGTLHNLDHTLAEAGVDVQDLHTLATKLKCPLLLARTSAMLYSTQLSPSPTSSGFVNTPETARALWGSIESIFMSFGIRDWLDWQSLGGNSIKPTMDVCWWGRYMKEVGDDNQLSYTDHEGKWSQMYAETRVRAFLMRGASAIPHEEVSLWNGPFGSLVEYMSLKESSVTDHEIELVAASCPSLLSLDVSNTAITDSSFELLMSRCPSLSDIKFDGTAITPPVKQRLLQFVSGNAAAQRQLRGYQ